ncbi:uncharacterized protein LOC142107804 isoform X2 [Mixophyes fleayi]|uniref:uncharacterized protein LOC142107804 isoform X2 n=1 Tax=Mixophyes fleayi TaxID=3061075 RepID=UPI003F4E28E7
MKFSYIGALCVFMALIAAAQCLFTCNECWVIGGTECCNVKNTTCPLPGCMTMSEYCVVEDKHFRSIRKTCGNELCNLCLTVTTGLDFNVRVSTQCGKGDGSNANLNFTESCNNLTTNGLKCPRCYNGTSAEGCADNGTVACVGKEMQCADYAGVVQYSDGSVNYISYKGCIVTGGCLVGFLGLPGTKEIKRKTFNCTAATSTILNLPKLLNL